MPTMENISTLENSSSILSVTLHENHFTNDGTYYATVSRNRATFKNILSEIAEDNKGMDPFMLQFAAILIQKKILKMLEQGKAVNVLDLGTLYIAMKCNAKGKSEVSESGNFYIKFTPTALANKAIDKLGVDKVVYAGTNLEIIEITDLSNEEAENAVTCGKPCRISGAHLKIGGENGGVWFASVDAEGEIDMDESSWVRVEDKDLFRNKPTELNLFVPSTLTPGNYRVVIRTTYLSQKKNRKSLLETVSDVINVVAA